MSAPLFPDRLRDYAASVAWQARPEIGADLVAAAERIEELEREQQRLIRERTRFVEKIGEMMCPNVGAYTAEAMRIGGLEAGVELVISYLDQRKAERVEELERERDALLGCLVYQAYDDDGGGPFWQWSWCGVRQGAVASYDEGVAKVRAAAMPTVTSNHSHWDC